MYLIRRANGVHCLACEQADGDTLVSGSDDTTLRVWDIPTGKCTHVLQGHTDHVYCLQVKDPRAPHIVSAHDHADLCRLLANKRSDLEQQTCDDSYES